ncbi:McrC family protein [Agrococcus sp. HG114]|uniref:McrC family protein n=1 Tax=Agrococcus sp. HG114 TaxID=2969757 RepID=UPI00215AD009|nr:McrC family protein [Agrococcus sp. HG114]MCR8669766.1 McrC family protein [Agrococcus sp. HG114]
MLDVVLRENEWRRVRLTALQTEELVAAGRELAGRRLAWRSSEDDDADRSAIAIVAAGAGEFRLSFSNVIGVVALTGLTLRIVPKIDLSHFLFIAAHALQIEPRMSASLAAVEPHAQMQEVLARALVAEAQRCLRLGLQRGYADRSYEAASVRGTIELVATTRNVLSGRMRVRGRADDFVADTPLNRLVKEALRRVASDRFLSGGVRGIANELLRDFNEVGPIVASDVRPALSRGQTPYRRLADLCRVVVEAGGIGLAKGGTGVESFLLATPGIVESGIRELLTRALAPYEVQPRGGGKVLVKAPPFSVHPDLLLTKAPLTGDVKYRLTRSGWNRSAVAQSVMFAAAYGSPVGFIVGFTDREARSLPGLALGSITIHELWWPALPSVSPQAAAARVADSLRQAIGTMQRVA